VRSLGVARSSFRAAQRGFRLGRLLVLNFERFFGRFHLGETSLRLLPCRRQLQPELLELLAQGAVDLRGERAALAGAGAVLGGAFEVLDPRRHVAGSILSRVGSSLGVLQSLAKRLALPLGILRSPAKRLALPLGVLRARRRVSKDPRVVRVRLPALPLALL